MYRHCHRKRTPIRHLQVPLQCSVERNGVDITHGRDNDELLGCGDEIRARSEVRIVGGWIGAGSLFPQQFAREAKGIQPAIPTTDVPPIPTLGTSEIESGSSAVAHTWHSGSRNARNDVPSPTLPDRRIPMPQPPCETWNEFYAGTSFRGAATPVLRLTRVSTPTSLAYPRQ